MPITANTIRGQYRAKERRNQRLVELAFANGPPPTPAIYKSAKADIPDFAYVDDDSISVVSRAAAGTISAHRLYHATRPFEDVLMSLEAAVEKKRIASKGKKQRKERLVADVLEPRKRPSLPPIPLRSAVAPHVGPFPKWLAIELGRTAACPMCEETINLERYRVGLRSWSRPPLHECGPTLPNGQRAYRYGSWPEAVAA